MNKSTGNVLGQSFTQACAPREAEVPEVINRLSMLIGDLETQLGGLIHRLSPVINHRPVGNGDCCAEKTYATELAASIQSANDRIAALSRQVEYTRDSLEL